MKKEKYTENKENRCLLDILFRDLISTWEGRSGTFPAKTADLNYSPKCQELQKLSQEVKHTSSLHYRWQREQLKAKLQYFLPALLAL